METEKQDNPSASQCPHCKGSLAGLPKIARFCPRCGKAIAAFTALTVRQTLMDGLHQLADAVKEDLPACPAAAKVEEEEAPPSMVLLGFSNAMFRLGWKYEHGHGVFRNESEAGRCYSKSARLGNENAKERLLDSNQ